MTEQQFSHYEAAGSSSPEPVADPWRNEVQDRLERYKRRRGRRIEGAFTMRFAFPPDETVATPIAAETVAAVAEPTEIILEESAGPEARVETWATAHACDPDGAGPLATIAVDDGSNMAAPVDLVLDASHAPEPELEPFMDMIVRPKPKRKVIAFPKHLSVAPEAIHRLADPVTEEVPRILDVPEELEAIPTTPFLDGLQLDTAGSSAQHPHSQEHVELPFRAVGISQRVLAGVVDFALTALGVGVFASVAYKILDRPPVSKTLIFGVGVVAVVLWCAYQYLFVVHAGQTLGMKAARIKLQTFRGKSPTMRQRRHRVLGFYLSALSLGMGLMWAFVDVDTLCWHDRISRTYLSGRGEPRSASFV